MSQKSKKAGILMEIVERWADRHLQCSRIVMGHFLLESRFALVLVSRHRRSTRQDRNRFRGGPVRAAYRARAPYLGVGWNATTTKRLQPAVFKPIRAVSFSGKAILCRESIASVYGPACHRVIPNWS